MILFYTATQSWLLRSVLGKAQGSKENHTHQQIRTSHNNQLSMFKVRETFSLVPEWSAQGNTLPSETTLSVVAPR